MGLSNLNTRVAKHITFPLSYPGDGAALLMQNEAGSSPAEGAKTISVKCYGSTSVSKTEG